RHIGRSRGDLDSGGLERSALLFGGAFTTSDDGTGVTHAFAGRRGRPGDEGRDRLFHAGLDVGRRALLGLAADLADHDDTSCARVAVNQHRAADEAHAGVRITADAYTSGLTNSERGELSHRFVGERARARNDADRTGSVDVAGHDAHLASAGGDDPWAV